MSGGVAGFVVGKVFGVRRRRAVAQAVADTRHNHPKLLEAYAAFSAAHQVSAARQPFKGWDLWQVLEKRRPRSIAEMGSGTTSAVFALWGTENGAKYCAYEHHAGWAQVTESCLRKAGLIDPAQPAPVRVAQTRVSADGLAVGFVEPIPADADFIYIDGPPCVLDDGRKVANDDIVRFFASGALPRTIVLDGRLETVDLILSHPVAERYAFSPAYVYCCRRGMWSSALQAGEHSVFTLR